MSILNESFQRCNLNIPYISTDIIFQRRMMMIPMIQSQKEVFKDQYREF